MNLKYDLIFNTLSQKPELVCDSIIRLTEDHRDCNILQQILVAEINPDFSGGTELCLHYNIPYEIGANCVIVEGTRGQNNQFAACVYPVNTRIDMNGVVRKKLNARRVSLAAVDEVIKTTGMEYGSITPVGLPKDWTVLIDSNILSQENIIIGSGKVSSKIYLPTELLIQLTKGTIVKGLVKTQCSE